MASVVTGLTNFPALQTQNRMKTHSESTAQAISQLASGKRINAAKDDSSGAAIASIIQSTLSVLNQTKLNAANAGSLIAVATGTLNDQRDLLTSMSTLIARAKDITLDDASRAMVNNDFTQSRDELGAMATRARYNGVALLSGGAGTVSLAGAVTQAETGVVAGPTNTLIANTTLETGYVNGVATEATVEAVGAGYNIAVKIGDQWFKADHVLPANNLVVTLVSTIDSGAKFAITMAADASGISSVATFQAALDQTFGLTSAGANANFLAVSTAVNNGLTGVTAASTAKPGAYAVRYDANSNILRLTDGETSWTKTVVAGAQSVTFANGITATLDGTFALATAVTQVVFDVANTSQVTLNVQIAEQATDTMAVNLPGTTLAALGLSTATVDTVANAMLAEPLVANALSVVNNAYSTLGAQQKRLDFVQSNLDTSTENLTGAKSAIEDADIAVAMTNSMVANTMSQISSVALSQSLQMTQQMLNIVRG